MSFGEMVIDQKTWHLEIVDEVVMQKRVEMTQEKIKQLSIL
jgi:hypothetical protein